jgi:hypothetical protein
MMVVVITAAGNGMRIKFVITMIPQDTKAQHRPKTCLSDGADIWTAFAVQLHNNACYRTCIHAQLASNNIMLVVPVCQLAEGHCVQEHTSPADAYITGCAPSAYRHAHDDGCNAHLLKSHTSCA